MIDEKKGDKQFKKAKDQITISVFNWSKDYASAASLFDDAFKIYKECHAYDKCLKTLNQLIICNQKMIDSWAVARNYEKMLEILTQNMPEPDIQRITNTAKTCFVQFQLSQSIDKGLQMLTRVNKFLASKGHKEQGLELLKEAYNIALEDEKSFKKKDIFNLIVESFLENEMYQETIKMYYDHIKMKNGDDCDSEGLIIVIIMLIMGQANRAENQMFELGNVIPTFLTSGECESAENLIKAYKQGQVQVFKKQTTRAAVTTLFPLIIIRKLRNVIVPSAQQFYKIDKQDQKKIKQNLLF